MKLLFSRLYVIIILGLLLGSFITGPRVLNENNVYKKIWFELLITCFSSFTILEFVSRKTYKFSINLIDILLGLLLVNHFIIAVWSQSDLIFRSSVYFYILFYFVLRLAIDNAVLLDIEIYKRFFIKAVPIVVLFHISIVFIQYFGLIANHSRNLSIGSTFGSPDMLGSYLATLVPFCFIEKKNNHIFGYSILLLTLVTLVILQARSAILALLGCGIIWLMTHMALKMRTLAIVTGLSFALLSLLILWHPESVTGRLFVWIIALKMIFQKPMGWGLNAFEKNYPEFQASIISANEPFPQFISPEVVHTPYNEFINIGVSLGVSGLFLYTLLVIIIFSRGIKLISSEIYPLISFLIVSLFYFPFKIDALVCLIIPMLALISAKLKMNVLVCTSKRLIKLIYFSLLVISTLLAIGSIKGLVKYNMWRYAFSISMKTEHLIESERIFNELYPYFGRDGHFLITFADQRSFAGDYTSALRLLEEAQNYYCDITLSLKLAKLYEMQGFYVKARERYDLAVNLAPNQISAAYERILFLIRIGAHKDAFNACNELLRKSNYKSSYADTHIIISRVNKIIRDYECATISNHN